MHILMIVRAGISYLCANHARNKQRRMVALIEYIDDRNRRAANGDDSAREQLAASERRDQRTPEQKRKDRELALEIIKKHMHKRD